MASNNEEVPSPSSYEPGGLPVVLDQKVLEEAFSKALAGFMQPLSSSKCVGKDATAEFFQLYKRESEEFDKEFIKKYDKDADTTLIFAGLFSAVASAFLIDTQKNLQPDYAQVSAALLQILLYKVNNSTFSMSDFPLPTWDGPTQTMVTVQSLLYISLLASLMAAFGAMLGKQWIGKYSRAENRGSLIDRTGYRVRKAGEVKRWRFDLVMESLPEVLQIALFLLGLALSLYLSTISTQVGVVVIFFTSLGVVLYVTIVICGTLWYDCPFQTPASIFIRTLLEYVKNRSGYFFSRYKGQQYHSRLVDANMEEAASELECVETQKDPPPLFEEKDINWTKYSEDAHCICWMLEISTNADVPIAITRFIPEVQWHSGIDVTPSLDKLWNDFDACYDDTALLSDQMIAERRDKAYVTLKAFIHLYAQRRGVDNIPTFDRNVVDRNILRYVEHPTLKHDDRILLTLTLLCGRLDDKFPPLNGYLSLLNDYLSDVSIHDLTWMLHIIIHRLKKDEPVHDHINIHEFIRSVLERDNSPPILTDCFLAIGLTIGMTVHINDLMVFDKSTHLDGVVRMLFDQITLRIEHLEHLDWTIATLKTLTYCKNPPKCLSVVCYGLCHTIIGSTIEERERWKAAQLVMQIGFRHSPSLRLQAKDCVGWPSTGLKFLEHQFSIEDPEESDYDTTADIFSALSTTVYWPNDTTDLTKSFLSGMIASLQADKPVRLKQQTFRFISRFRRRIFDAGVEAMSGEEKRILLSALLSEVDMERGKDCREMLKDAITSRVWRRSLGIEHLKLLESLVSSIGFGYGIGDAMLIPALADENFLDGAVLKTWVQVIWLDMHIVSPHSSWQMMKQAESAIKDLFFRRPDLMDEFRRAINLQSQIEHYKCFSFAIQLGINKLEEVCEEVTGKSPEDANFASSIL